MKTFSENELADFLTEHRDEWWTPNEIAKEKKVDIRTIKTMIKRLSYSLNETYTGIEAISMLTVSIQPLTEASGLRWSSAGGYIQSEW